MEEHRGTRFSSQGLISRGELVPVIAGELHYWRLDPADWRARLIELRDLGFTMVSTFVPWSVHETGAGRFDWSGRRDLPAFASIADEAGLKLIVRPGPAVNAELTLFGFPERILASEEIGARTGLGTPAWLPAPPRMFPIPSYASTRFIDEASAWLGEVGRTLQDCAAPEGPLVALQLDNELGMFFRTGAYDLDYHPDALSWWDEHSGGLEAPRSWSEDDAERCARWVDFKDFYAGRALEWIADALRDAGLGDVAHYHNAPTVRANAVGAVRSGLRAKSLPAWNLHLGLAGDSDIREISMYLDGSVELPFAAELGAGAPSYLPPPHQETQRAAALTAIGSGIRAFNIYMAVGRDRWTDAALDPDGADWVARLLAAITKLECWTLRRDAAVAVIETRADSRYAVASSTVGPVTPQLAGLLDLGPGGFAELSRDVDARKAARWRTAIAAALDAFEIPYVFIDEAASLERMSRYGALICPTLRRIDASLWEKLLAVAGTDEGDTRVILGPGTPVIDAYGQPLDDRALVAGMGLLRGETLTDLDALAGDLLAACGELPDDWIAPDAPAVVTSVLSNERGEPRAVVLINRGETAMVELAVPSGTVLHDAMHEERFADERELGVLSIELDAGDSRLFSVE